MVPHRLDLKKVLTIVVAISILFFILILFLTNQLTQESLLPALLRIGTAITIGSGVWFLIDRYLWRYQPLRSLFNIRDIGGRYEGTLRRTGEGLSRSFTIEIYQTLTTLQVTTYSRRSTSRSIISNLATDVGGRQLMLVYLWIGTGGPLDGQEQESEMFYGTTILDSIINPDKPKDRVLKGHYFTNRKNPHLTSGRLELSWKGNKLYGRHEI